MSARAAAATMAGAQVQAQAKVNLRLCVLAREESGYHQIETLVLRLALADTVRIRLTSGRRSLDVNPTSSTSGIGPPINNLAWRAADEYFAASGWSGGFAIEIEKRIPIGAGLGGGSADAGAVLRALNALAENRLGERALLSIAATIGSDVPFLASEHAYALGWGRGERLLGLPPPSSRAVELVVPPFRVNTTAAYGWLAESRAASSTRDVQRAGFLDGSSLSNWDGVASLAVNDFEPVVSARYSEIASIVAELRRAGCPIAMLSGSGSTVFGVSERGGAVRSEHQALELPGGRVVNLRKIFTATAREVEPVVLLD